MRLNPIECLAKGPVSGGSPSARVFLFSHRWCQGCWFGDRSWGKRINTKSLTCDFTVKELLLGQRSSHGSERSPQKDLKQRPRNHLKVHAGARQTNP